MVWGCVRLHSINRLAWIRPWVSFQHHNKCAFSPPSATYGICCRTTAVLHISHYGLDSNSHCNTGRRYVTATQHHIARNNGFHRQMCGLMIKMQCVGRTYQRTITRAILWFWMVRVSDELQPSTRFCHTCLPWVRRNTKVLFLGSLSSTLLDHLASWASICRPIYPRTRLNRRNEPERPTCVKTVRTKRNETMNGWGARTPRA